MQVDMNVETREAVGKGVARTLRQQGKIPGVLYGQGECISLTIDPAEIRKVLHSESGSNTLLNVRIAKGGKEIQRTAMLRDYQLDPVTGAILHADLFEIAMDKPIRVRVPVAVTDGTPVGVAKGAFSSTTCASCSLSVCRGRSRRTSWWTRPHSRSIRGFMSRR